MKDLGSVSKGIQKSPKKDGLIMFYLNNPIPNPLNVTFTQKQRNNKTNISNIESSNNFKHFLNLLNRKVFKKSSQRFGKKIRSFVIREYDEIHNHHIHCILEIPTHIPLNKYKMMIRECWRNTYYGNRQIHFEKPKNSERKFGWLNYILKEYTKPNYFDCVDWVNVN